MNSEILINMTPQETRVAVIEQGVVQELHIERTSSRGIVGNIYNGRVSRVLPGMQSAFIDIGLERAAFLHVADIKEFGSNTDTDKPIERLLFEGANILVQVIKDAIGTKGARLSTQISIAGRMLVYLPHECHIGISQRIEDNAERESLREKLQHVLPLEDKGGYIIRTMAEAASESDLRAAVPGYSLINSSFPIGCWPLSIWGGGGENELDKPMYASAQLILFSDTIAS